MAERRLWNIATTHKLPYEERDIAHAHMSDETWMEQMSEEVPEGEPTHFAAWLTDEGAAAFGSASNLGYIEEAATDEAFGPIHNGVDRDMLTMHRMLDIDPGALTPLLLVADTGATENAYVRSRMLDKWTWFSDSGDDKNGHGGWCLGAATPPESGKFVVSAKVLGDNGSGANSNGIAALYRFARLCRDRGAPGVASLSLGSNSPSTAYKDAVDYCLSQNVAVIAAAGNDGRRDGVSYPGAYAVSVGAHDRSFVPAGFSSRNASHSLPDGYALGTEVNGIGLGGKTSVKSGSSMSTPAVARAVHYCLSRGMRASAVKSAVRTHNGAGRVLDAGKLLPKESADPNPSPLKPNPAPLPGKPADPKPDPDTRYQVVAEELRSREDAREVMKRLQGDGYPGAFVAKSPEAKPEERHE